MQRNGLNIYNEVRRLRRQQEHIKREQLGDALSQSRHNEFWKVVRNIAKSNKGTRSNIPCVNQCSSDTDIANPFGSKLRCLLNTDTCISSECCDGLGFICELINDNYLLHILFNLFCVNLCAKVFLSPLFL